MKNRRLLFFRADGVNRAMEYIDIDTWDRKDNFNGYLGTDFPYINIGANLDVTRLLRFCRERDLSSYLTMVFSAHQVASQIINFRYRIKDGRPILNDRIYPIFTYLLNGTDIFINVMPEYADELTDFIKKAKEQIARQGTDLGAGNIRGRYDIISYTVMPWIQYTHFVRTIAKFGVDSNPKISWGKYFKQGKKMLMPFSVQVHHGLMDGLHVGRYFEALQKYIDQLA
jgi:chloramphenicol O-acetyltransferase type A